MTTLILSRGLSDVDLVNRGTAMLTNVDGSAESISFGAIVDTVM